MRKRIAAGILVLALVVATGIIFVFQTSRDNQITQQMRETNVSIQELKAEKDALNEKLAEIEQTENTTEGDKQISQAQPVVLCVNSAAASVYSDIYPAMREAEQVGILILRDNVLPGNSNTMSVKEFLEMMDQGWEFAISLTRTADETDDAWQTRIEAYQTRLQQRVAMVPHVYCFAEGGCSEKQAEILKEQGMNTILVHEATTEMQEFKVIQLLPYQQDNLAAAISGIDGYCGLEVGDNADELSAYSAEAFQNLLNSELIQLKNLDTLEKIVPKESEQADQYNDPESIRSRLKEIEAEIDALYD